MGKGERREKVFRSVFRNERKRSEEETHQIFPCPPPPILGISGFPLCMCAIILALEALDVICECDLDCFLFVSRTRAEVY